MQTLRASLVVTSLLILLALTPKASAQADQSTNFTPPLAIYHGSNVEQVILPRGTVRVSIPLLHLKGRGLDLDVNATFNNITWTTTEIDDTSGDRLYDSMPILDSGGWGIGVARMGTVGGGTPKCLVAGEQGCVSYAYYADFLSSDHSKIELGDDNGTHFTDPPPTRFWSSDGSYMRIPTSNGNIVPKLIFKDGTSINQHFNAQNQIDTVILEDTNGNMISCGIGLSYSCTDTLGRVVTFNSSGSLTTIQYHDSSGVLQTIRITWQGFQLDVPWANSSENTDPNCPGGGMVPPWVCYSVDFITTQLVTDIALPNNLHYSFQYQTNPNGTTTGQIAKITLPTGGYIKYENSEGAYPSIGLPPQPEPWESVASRTVSSDGTAASEKKWQYGAGDFESGYGVPNKVTDPLGNTENSFFGDPNAFFAWNLFCPPAPTRIDYKDASGRLLKQVFNSIGNDTTSYTDPAPSSFVGSECDNPRTTATTTVLSDTNQQSQTTFSYGSFGNVIEKDETDWGSGRPGSILRKTTYSYWHDSRPAYAADTAHIVDRVNVEKVCNANGTFCSQTTTSYDDTALTPTTNIFQHDYATFSSSNTVRGNATHISRFVNTTGGSSVTTNQYNDVGNLIQAQDPNGNTTSFSYADNFANGTPTQPSSAYPTTISLPTTNGTGHIQRFQYYFNTGLTAASCGQNFPGGTNCATGMTGSLADYQSFTWDLMNRPLTNTSGDGGQTSISYNESSLPISYVTTTKIDATHNLAKNTVYDGLGRASQTQITSDPSGTTYQLTSYDEIGRKSKVYNPTRCNPPGTNCGETSWGYKLFEYDGLGRTKTVTSQDGGVSKSEYLGNQTTITDQAGTEKRTSTDSLGRIIEVDERRYTTAPLQNNYATLQSDGNFVLYTQNNLALWATGTSGSGGGPFEVQDDGNLVLYKFKWQAGTYRAWSGATFPYDPCRVNDSLFAGGVLLQGQCLENTTNTTFAVMDNGNLEIYDRQLGRITWQSNTWGHPNAFLSMQSDGNLVIYTSGGAGLWASGTAGSGANVATLENDGRLIMYSTVWTSGTSPGSAPGSFAHPSCDLGPALGTTGAMGAGQCLVSRNGRFELLLQSDGNLVLYDESQDPAAALWSTETAVTVWSPGVALQTLYTYDPLGNLTCVEQHGDVGGTGCGSLPSSDATSPWRVRRFTYDSLARLIAASNPESGNTTYFYDGNGNLLQKTSPAPNQTGAATQTISYCYDALNRLTGKAYSAQSCPLTSPVASYFYDQSTFNGLATASGVGRRTGMIDQAGAEAWSYDLMGRIHQDQRTTNGISKNTVYLYDVAGLLGTVFYPAGHEVMYFYNTALQPTSVFDQTNGTTYVVSSTYSAAGAPSLVSMGSGAKSSSFYNSRLQPCRVSVTTGSSVPSNCSDLGTIGNILDLAYGFGFGTGDNGNLLSVSNNRDSARTQSFAYDQLNRLSAAQTSSTSGTKCFGESFGYDPWGNLLTIGGVTGYAGCTQENLGVTATLKNQVSSNSYDAAGNVTTGGNVYDAENHLVTAAGVTYTYDGDGKRVEKSSGKIYWYGMGPEVLDETDLTGSSTSSAFSEYIFFNGNRISRRDASGNVFLYFADHLGTSRALVQSGQTIACYDADFYPFGGERPLVNTCPQNYKFTGKERDTETTLDYFGARYYSNVSGRFISVDPRPAISFQEAGDEKSVEKFQWMVRNPQSWNLYAYSLGNPLRFTDPSGETVLETEGDANEEIKRRRLEQQRAALTTYAKELAKQVSDGKLDSKKALDMFYNKAAELTKNTSDALLVAVGSALDIRHATMDVNGHQRIIGSVLTRGSLGMDSLHHFAFAAFNVYDNWWLPATVDANVANSFEEGPPYNRADGTDADIVANTAGAYFGQQLYWKSPNPLQPSGKIDWGKQWLNQLEHADHDEHVVK